MTPARVVKALGKRRDYLVGFIAQTDEREYPGRVGYARGELAALYETLAMWEKVRERRARALADGDKIDIDGAISLVAIETKTEPWGEE
jgi:hypothetical protein